MSFLVFCLSFLGCSWVLELSLCQATSHDGAAGVGLVSLRGLQFSCPLLTTAECNKRYWEKGKALHGILPTGSDRIAHIFGGLWDSRSRDPEKLIFIEILFQAVFFVRLTLWAVASHFCCGGFQCLTVENPFLGLVYGAERVGGS